MQEEFMLATVPRAARGQAALSVTEVNQRAKQLLEGQFATVAVVGEVSNVKVVSGHLWFTLKDATAQLAAVMFRREAAGLKFLLKAGMEMVATGRLTVYGAYGRFQMVCDRLEPCGAGALQTAFEQLKEKLAAEGLFAAERKRPLPLLPRGVGVITSPTGAVIRDIVHVALRRFPQAHLMVLPTRVQGAEAAPEITAALERGAAMARQGLLEVLIVARGGGSLEDLWAFNDERVARAMAAAPVPVVSAVGHETDFTVADFVADRRAPTPSAAAEIVFPLKHDLKARCAGMALRMRLALQREVTQQRWRCRLAGGRLGDGAGLLHDPQQRLSLVEAKLHQSIRAGLDQRRYHLQAMAARWVHLHPRYRLQHWRMAVERAVVRVAQLVRARVVAQRQRLTVRRSHLDHGVREAGVVRRWRLAAVAKRAASHQERRRWQHWRVELMRSQARRELALKQQLTAQRRRLALFGQRLQALSPLSVLERGYAIVLCGDGQAVRRAADTAVGDLLQVRLAQGSVTVRVETVQEGGLTL